jgi:hypothetical protein
MDDRMNTDKILILIATLMAFTAIYFRHPIIDEFVTYKNIEAYIDEMEQNDRKREHYPLSLEEGLEVSKELAQKTEIVHKQIGNSVLLKYLVDFSDKIEDLQTTVEILQYKIDTGETFTYLDTLKNNSIIAIPEFSKEQLLHLAALIDQYHPEGAAEAEFQFYVVDDGTPTLEIISPSHPNTQFPYQQLVDHISKDMFNGEEVILIPGATEEEDEEIEIYVSEDRNLTNRIFNEPSKHPHLF